MDNNVQRGAEEKWIARRINNRHYQTKAEKGLNKGSDGIKNEGFDLKEISEIKLT